MLRAKQIIYIAIVSVSLTAVLGAASTEQTPPKQSAAAQPNGNLKDDKPNIKEGDPAFLAIENVLQAIAVKLGPAPDADAKAAKEDKRGDEDLKAQKKMAHWAKVMAWLTVAQIIIGAVGIFFVVQPLKQNRVAVRAAMLGVRQANRSLRLSEDTAEKELRARLSVLPRGVNPLSGVDGGVGHVAVKNIGKIPAQAVALHVFMKFSNANEINFPVPGDEPIDKRINRTLQPDTEMIEGSKQEPLIEFIDGTKDKYAYVWGISYYDDGYGGRRMTKFCHRYHTAKVDQGWRMRREIPVSQTPRPTNIIPSTEARFHTSGNEAD